MFMFGFLVASFGCVAQGVQNPATTYDGGLNRPLLFTGVYTAPTHEGKLRRHEIRHSYFNHKLVQPGGPVVCKFIVGWTDSHDPDAQELENEIEKRPRQFLRLDVKEQYGNLTHKTMSFLRWFAVNSRAHFLLKMDDDTFPHFGPIVKYLKKERETGRRKYLHMGLMFPCAPVLKSTKWAENPEIWNHSFFPKYMQGSGYFLSTKLVQEIASRHYDRNSQVMLNNEDAAVGLWIEMLTWKGDSPIRIEQKTIPATLSGCGKDDLLSMNNLLGYIGCYWRRLERGEKDVCCHGPLNNLRQSLLQTGSRVSTQSHLQAAAKAKMKARLGCYGEMNDYTGGIPISPALAEKFAEYRRAQEEDENQNDTGS